MPPTQNDRPSSPEMSPQGFLEIKDTHHMAMHLLRSDSLRQVNRERRLCGSEAGSYLRLIDFCVTHV